MLEMLVSLHTEKQKAEVDRIQVGAELVDKRIGELSKILNKLYEDAALEKISEERYQAMAPKYELGSRLPSERQRGIGSRDF